MNTSEPDSTGDSTPTLKRLAMAVDSHGWEDFPSHLVGDDAQEILASWTALWHPALLANSHSIPEWHRIDQIPEQPAGWVLVVPGFSKELLDRNDKNRFVDRGGLLFVGSEEATSRTRLSDSILQQAGITFDFGEQAIADFYSLGYCYLQIQLMTRQLRYSSSLDEECFSGSVRKAVGLAAETTSDDYQSAIQSCFDQLIEERSRYYPTTANLIDLVFVTKDLVDGRLEKTLNQANRMSLHCTGETCRAILNRPELHDQVRQQVTAGKLCLVGGDEYELPASLLSTWSSLRELQRGVAEINRLVDDWPAIYARRTFGLRVGLPAVLDQLDIPHVVHSTLDDGVFPQTSANHIRWEGDDGTTVDAIVSPPKLATAPETWLNLGVRIGEVIDINQYASLMFVRWPNQGADYYFDLVHSCRFGAVLGNFVTLDEYFQNAADPGYTQNYQADDYRDPYLNQLVQRKTSNPISGFSDYWRDLVRAMSLSGSMVMAAACDVLEDPSELSIEHWVDHLNRSFVSGDTSLPMEAAVDFGERVEKLEQILEQKILGRVVSGTNQVSASNTATDSSQSAVAVFNPFSFPRRCYVPLPGIAAEHPSVLVSDTQGAIVDLPAMGLANLKKGPVSVSKRKQLTAEEVYLRNEFFEVEVDEKTGGIGAIKLHGKRANMLAQQIVFRETRDGQSRSGTRKALASTMVCDEVKVTESSQARGQITSHGKLMLGQQVVSSFQQTMTLNRGMSVLELEIELEPVRWPKSSPWHNYIACRFAMKDELADFYSWHNESRHNVVRQRIVAPLALEIDQHDFKTAILTNGLPFHQRIGDRRLDSLMVVQGERQKRFRLGVGVNLRYPCAHGLQFIDSERFSQSLLTGSSQPATDEVSATANDRGANIPADHAWLFHLNCKNVVALYWYPMDDGRGVKVLLKETEGRRGELALSCCRDVESASVNKVSGTFVRQLQCEGNKVLASICAHEMIELSLFW